MKPSVPFEDTMEEWLRDPEEARDYVAFNLQEFQRDGDRGLLLAALRHAVLAQGGMSKVARKAGLNRANLYEALSATGNPGFDTVVRILKAMGMGLSVVPLEPARAPRKAKATKVSVSRAKVRPTSTAHARMAKPAPAKPTRRASVTPRKASTR